MKTLIESFVHFLKEDLFDDETGWPLMNYDDETGKRMRVYDYGTEGLVKPSPRGDHPILKNALAGEMSSDPQREAGFLGPQNVRDDVLDHPWVASKPAAPKQDKQPSRDAEMDKLIRLKLQRLQQRAEMGDPGAAEKLEKFKAKLARMKNAL